MTQHAVVEREAAPMPVIQGGAVTPMSMIQMAVQQGADIEKLQKLMDLQERWEKNEARKAFNEAFAAFKTEAVRVIKNKDVKQGPLAGKSYAELFSVVDAVTPALSEHGLTASWSITKDEKDWIEVTCQLKHVLGHSEAVSMGGPPDVGGAKSPIQARASTISYLQRYTLKAICGVAERDDDKNGEPVGKVAPDAEGQKALEACGSLSALQDAWKALRPEQRKTLAGVKEDCKARIQAADKAAA